MAAKATGLGYVWGADLPRLGHTYSQFTHLMFTGVSADEMHALIAANKQ